MNAISIGRGALALVSILAGLGLLVLALGLWLFFSSWD